MAYDVTGLTDYVARENAALTKTLFAGGDSGKFANFISGVKGSTKIPLIPDGVTLLSGNCPTPSGDRVMEEVTLSVAGFTVYESFCQEDLEDKFPNMILAPGSRNGEDAIRPWEEEMIDTIIAGVNEELEQTYWQGDVDGGGDFTLFDGFIELIDAGSPIDGNPDGIDTDTGIVLTNVRDVVEGMYSNHTNAKVKRSGNFVILAGDDVFDLYIQKLKADNLYHYAPEHDNGVYRIGGSGATLIRCYGLNGTNRLFSSVGSNFHVGSDVENEQDVADVFYDRTDDKVYVRVKATAGVAVSNIDEIAEFTLDTPAT
jgi:hypothetical protein